MDFRGATAALVVLTMALAASTGYLLVSPGRGTTSTVFTTSTNIVTSTLGVSSPYSVGIAFNRSIGFYLVNGSGFTLYYRTADIRSTGTSTCTGGCIQTWPAFYASNLVLPPGLDSGAFRVVARADGIKQLTFNGWPLYIFKGDMRPGDTHGEGIGGVWFAYSLGGAGSTTTTASSTSSYLSTSVTSSTTATSTSTTSTTSTTTTATSTTTTTTTTTSSSCYYYCP